MIGVDQIPLLFLLCLREDEWLCAALDCLDFLPDQPVVEFSRELPRFFPPDQDSVDCQTVSKDTQGEGKYLNLLKDNSAYVTKCCLLLF